jgi:hypothetical protein
MVTSSSRNWKPLSPLMSDTYPVLVVFALFVANAVDRTLTLAKDIRERDRQAR